MTRRAAYLVLFAAAASCVPRGEAVDESMPVRAYPESGIALHPDSALRAELLAMREDDQALRAELTPETFQDSAFMARIDRGDTARSIRLREIIAEHGWPDAARLGPEAVNAAFLIVQHTPFDDFREAMLPYVERDVRAGILDPQDYAGMVDRIRLHRGELQLYGSSYTLVDGVMVRDPVEDPANLDRRRADLGLIPIAEYERLLGEFYQAPVRAEP